MKTTFRRNLSLLLTAMLLFTMLPANAVEGSQRISNVISVAESVGESGTEADPLAGRSDINLAVVNTTMNVDETTQFGDTVTICFTIENFYGWDYTVQWQQKDSSGVWHDVPGATESTYSFVLTEDNLNTDWRVRVDVIVPDELLEFVG